MIAGILKKVIFSSFLLINFIQPSKSAEIEKINKSDDNLALLKSSSKASHHKNKSIGFNNIENFSDDEKFLKQNLEPFLLVNNKNQKELIIQSDQKSEINDFIYAEGNVEVKYEGKILKANKLTYDKLNKKISAQGDITLILGDQIFKVSQLEYSFITEKGYLLDVRGLINTNTLINDLTTNINLLDSNKIESLLEIKKKEVLYTPNTVKNWTFFAKKITVDGKKWKSKTALFSNDLLELKQAKLSINSLEVYPRDDKLRFKSTLNYLIIDEKVSIPFWLGDRAFDFENSQIKNRWNLGYEDLDKDGYFIGRRFNSIDIFDDFVLDL